MLSRRLCGLEGCSLSCILTTSLQPQGIRPAGLLLPASVLPEEDALGTIPPASGLPQEETCRAAFLPRQHSLSRMPGPAQFSRGVKWPRHDARLGYNRHSIDLSRAAQAQSEYSNRVSHAFPTT